MYYAILKTSLPVLFQIKDTFLRDILTCTCLLIKYFLFDFRTREDSDTSGNEDSDESGAADDLLVHTKKQINKGRWSKEEVDNFFT